MRQMLKIVLATLIILILFDFLASGALRLAERQGGTAQSLVRYFEYGRSVPGKLQRWVAQPDLRENLFNVAWPDAGLLQSAEHFVQETGDPVIRGYGMSFLAQIMAAATQQTPELNVDLLGGPAAPPNLTFELALQDRDNRRSGDIVVLALLSSSVPAMASLSNRSWAFEQPAPLTYPIFVPSSDGGLERIAPLVQSAHEERTAILQPTLPSAAEWADQLRNEDAFYTNAAFSWPWLDRSPLARLIRRSLAVGAIADREAKLLEGAFPYEEVLVRMVEAFAAMAREDGQIPIVVLIQSRDPSDLDLLAVTAPTLERAEIPYFATVQYADPADPRLFAPDGHYTTATNIVFADGFLSLLNQLGFVR